MLVTVEYRRLGTLMEDRLVGEVPEDQHTPVRIPYCLNRD